MLQGVVLVLLLVLAMAVIVGRVTGNGAGAAFGWLWRSSWGFLLWLWTAPAMRLVLAAGLLFLVLVWFWWPALIEAPGVIWAAIVVAGACALWGVAASSLHHTSPNWWRSLAIGRTAGYTILSGPLALALAEAVTQGVWGLVLGIVAWCLIATGLAAHLLTGSEFKQAPQQF